MAISGAAFSAFFCVEDSNGHGGFLIFLSRREQTVRKNGASLDHNFLTPEETLSWQIGQGTFDGQSSISFDEKISFQGLFNSGIS